MQIINSTQINESSDKLWNTLRSFDGVEKYLSIVTKSYNDGNVPGSKRTCDINMGHQMFQTLETLEILDDSNYILQVSLDEGPIQLKGMKFTFSVKRIEDGKSNLLISTEVGNPDAASTAKTIFAMIGQGLKKLHEQ
ncbi:MAG: SRPBCC family protein [Nitrosopumilaceae archaeon]